MQTNNRVLIVDDEMEFSETLTKMFRRRNIDVDSAESCRQAIEKILVNEFDVVIMDVSMPGIDGIQCLGKVKQQWPETEVIILTGHASIDSGIQGMKGGAFDYCLKPIDIKELLEKIELAFEKVQITRAKK